MSPRAFRHFDINGTLWCFYVRYSRRRESREYNDHPRLSASVRVVANALAWYRTHSILVIIARLRAAARSHGDLYIDCRQSHAPGVDFDRPLTETPSPPRPRLADVRTIAVWILRSTECHASVEITSVWTTSQLRYTDERYISTVSDSWKVVRRVCRRRSSSTPTSSHMSYGTTKQSHLWRTLTLSA